MHARNSNRACTIFEQDKVYLLGHMVPNNICLRHVSPNPPSLEDI